MTDEEAIDKALRYAGCDVRYVIDTHYYQPSLYEVGIYRLLWSAGDCKWHRLDVKFCHSEAECHTWAAENWPDAEFDAMEGGA